MTLSTNAVKALMTALTSAQLGNEVASAVNSGVAALEAQVGMYGIAAVIEATETSTTTDFGALKVDDKILQIPGTAGNAQYLVCATAGTLPEAAVVGDLYLVLRAFTAPSATNVKF